jgi:hypothetical protein
MDEKLGLERSRPKSAHWGRGNPEFGIREVLALKRPAIQNGDLPRRRIRIVARNESRLDFQIQYSLRVKIYFNL